MDTIINRVAQSGIITLNLETYCPSPNSITSFDLKDFLFMGLILKEKDFREALKQYNWETHAHSTTALFCSADAIIPKWAYMLAATYLFKHQIPFSYGQPETVRQQLWRKTLENIPVEEYRDKRVVIKGCGENEVPEWAFVEITQKLLPVVKSLMYGEPCSTVPIYKQLGGKSATEE